MEKVDSAPSQELGPYDGSQVSQPIGPGAVEAEEEEEEEEVDVSEGKEQDVRNGENGEDVDQRKQESTVRLEEEEEEAGSEHTQSIKENKKDVETNGGDEDHEEKEEDEEDEEEDAEEEQGNAGTQTSSDGCTSLEMVRQANILRNEGFLRDLQLSEGTTTVSKQPKKRKRKQRDTATPRKSDRLCKKEKEEGMLTVSENEEGEHAWIQLFQTKCVSAGKGVLALYPKNIAKNGEPAKTKGDNLDQAFLVSLDEQGRFSLYKHIGKMKEKGILFSTPKALAEFFYPRSKVEGDGFQLVYYKGKSLDEWRNIMQKCGSVT